MVEKSEFMERRSQIIKAGTKAFPLLQKGLFAESVRTKLVEMGFADDIASEAIQVMVQDGEFQAAQDEKSGNEPLELHVNLEAYYDEPRRHYIVKNQSNRWLRLDRTQVKNRLRMRGYKPKVNKGEPLSECDREILKIEETMDVKYAGSLAGKKEGFYEEGGIRMLITAEPKMLEPKEGKCVVIDAFLNKLFADDEHDQVVYFLAWLKIAYESIINQEYRPGQALVIPGPRNCGKSFLQRIITVFLGGRAAKPYQFMVGQTNFNADLFEAEHLIIEDDQPQTDIRSRRNFGSKIKEFTVNRDHRLHAKGRDAVLLSPLWRMSISLNDEPENLLILPPLDESIQDKLIILRAVSGAIPEATSQGDYNRIWDDIEAELPHLAHQLLNWEIPEEIRDTRYGVKHFHNPKIVRELVSQAPEMHLLELIDAHLLLSDAEWSGSSEGLKTELMNKEGACGYESKKLLTWHRAAGTYLGRLEKLFPRRISRRRIDNGARSEWTIKNEASLLEISNQGENND